MVTVGITSYSLSRAINSEIGETITHRRKREQTVSTLFAIAVFPSPTIITISALITDAAITLRKYSPIPISRGLL